MSRVEKLSDPEYKIVQAIRDITKDDTTIKQAAINENRRELENIYHDLLNVNGVYWEDEIPEIARRLYGLLY